MNRYESEAGLLGAVMRDQKQLENVKDLVKPSFFGWHPHGWAWKAILNLEGGRRPYNSRQECDHFK